MLGKKGERLFLGLLTKEEMSQKARLLYDLKDSAMVTAEEEQALKFAIQCIGILEDGTEGKSLRRYFKKRENE